MVLDEFLIALGLKVDNSDIAKAEKLGDSIDDIKDSADGAERSLTGAYEATDGFVSAIEGALGVLGFFTGILGGFLAATHGVITELEDLIKEEKLLTKVTKEQLDQAKKYNESVETLGKRFNSLRVEIAFGFLPTLQKLIGGLDDFLEANAELIANGLVGLLNAITSVFKVIGSFIRFIDLIVEKTFGWEKTLYILGAALLYVRRASILAFVTNPVFLIIAAIGVLLILIDDFITYLDGGQSEFGDFWGAMLEYIEVITPALKKLWDLLILGASYLIELGFFVTKYLGGAFVDAVEVVAAVWTLLVGLIIGDTELISAAWDGLIENLLSAFNNLAMLIDPIVRLITKIISDGFEKARVYVLGVLSQMLIAIIGFVSRVGSALSTVFTIITTPFRLAFDWIVNTFSKLPSLIGNIVSKLPGVNAITSIGSAVSSGVSRITNNYGGNTNANINVTAPNATSAANQTAAALQNTQAQRNVGGQAIA